MATPKALYHYTSIEALACILKNRSFRFIRLDILEDKAEGQAQSPFELRKMYFVSCWTNEDEESVPHWKIYSNGLKGVRIKVQGSLTNQYAIDKDNVPLRKGDTYTGGVFDDGTEFCLSWMSESSLYQGKTLINPPLVGSSCWPAPVDYVDKHEINPSGHIDNESKKLVLRYEGVGTKKKREFRFEQEWRFKLQAVPRGEESDDGFPPDSHVFVPIGDDAFRSLEITLGPRVSLGDRIIVETLIEQYCPSATVSSSSLWNLE